MGLGLPADTFPTKNDSNPQSDEDTEALYQDVIDQILRLQNVEHSPAAEEGH